MLEKDFLQSVRDMARLSGWMAYHTYRSDRSEPGFPDLVLCRPPRVIFAELKNEKGRVSDYQQWWLDRLGKCKGVEVFLWRPSDWGFDCGRVAAEDMSVMELTIAVVVLAAWGLMKRQALKDLFRYGCMHRRTTWPNRDEEGTYVRCLNCAARIAQPQWDEAREA